MAWQFENQQKFRILNPGFVRKVDGVASELESCCLLKIRGPLLRALKVLPGRRVYQMYFHALPQTSDGVHDFRLRGTESY